MYSINNTLKEYLLNSSLFFLVGFSSFFITKITHLSPFYFGFTISILYFFICLINNNKLNKKNSILIFSLISIIFVYDLINIIITDTYDWFFIILISYVINYVGLFLSTIISNSVQNKKVIIKSLIVFFSLSILVGIADAVYRFKSFSVTQLVLMSFYDFKSDSIMFDDSNWAGFIFMIAFSFYIYVRDKKFYRNWLIGLLLFVLVLLSLSRAAIVSSVLIIVYSRYIRMRKRTRLFLDSFIVITIFVLIPLVINLFMKDGSFGTKIKILTGFKYYLSNASITQLFFGNGTGAASNDLSLLGNCGFSGHLYVIIKVLDMGFIGLFLDVLLFSVLTIITKREFLYLLIPFIICGLSMCPTNLCFFYILTGVLVTISQSKRLQECNNE